MRQNQFDRKEPLDNAFFELHGIKPEVWYKRLGANEYSVKLVFGEKIFIITEKMKNGLSDCITMNYNGTDKLYNTYYDAEVDAARIAKE